MSKRMACLSSVLTFRIVMAFSAGSAPPAAPIKVGIIGLDAHAVPFHWIPCCDGGAWLRSLSMTSAASRPSTLSVSRGPAAMR